MRTRVGLCGAVRPRITPEELLALGASPLSRRILHRKCLHRNSFESQGFERSDFERQKFEAAVGSDLETVLRRKSNPWY
jgi:hypothetical protein